MKNRTNLIWLDLEMTGLNVAQDRILEIAVAVTDKNLEIIAEGPSLVIHQSNEVLESMNDWCKKQHRISGLTEDVQNSTITLEQAEQEVLAFLNLYCIAGQGILCGNSIWQDKAFIQAYMPQLYKFCHYKIVDVSSVKELIMRWYPKSPYSDFKKSEKHRAMADVIESIDALKNYRDHFFIPESVVAASER